MVDKGNKRNNKKVSKVKAAGLKSVFATNQKLIMTSFGNGNDAIIEKIIENDVIENVAKEPAFSVKKNEIEKKFFIEGRAQIKGNAENPLLENKPGEDLIHCKDALEVAFFGKTFNDNIHIQLIYSILDIEKKLASHINNIVYTLDNLRRIDKDEYDDFIGYISARNDYRTFCEPDKYLPKGQDPERRQRAIENIKNSKRVFDEYLKNPRLEYFGDVFIDHKKEGKKVVSHIKPENEIYTIISILGSIRQYAIHSNDSTKAWLYNLENPANNPADVTKVLDNLFEQKIKGIDNNFVKNNGKTNFTILSDIFGINIKDTAKMCELANNFYRFTVMKTYKNIGVSVKSLREELLKIYDEKEIARGGKGIRDKKYDSVRSKLYAYIDFIITEYYRNNETAQLTFINKLRTVLPEGDKNETDKGALYYAEAERVYPFVCKQITTAEKGVLKITDKDVKAIEDDLAINMQRSIDKLKISNSKVHYFSKAIYLLTLFLDGKEINDLLTTLIHAFENVDSFISVLKKEKIDYTFTADYRLFNDSKEIAQELRYINSFARMVTPSENAKRIMFEDAAVLLGTKYTRAELEAHLNLDGNFLPLLANGKKDHNFRNFIINNVIESTRFKYLIRYATPLKLRMIADNEYVVKFVLTTIAERLPQQILKYYNSCGGNKYNASTAEQIEFLTKMIHGLSFDNFSTVKNSAKEDNQYQNKAFADKEKKKACLSLYLTVLYLFVKNLIYVNARYTLAFHCLERDSQLKGSNAGFKGKNYCGLTNDYISQLQDERETLKKMAEELSANYKTLSNKEKNVFRRSLKKIKHREHLIEYLSKDVQEIDDETVLIFRNCVAHINPVRNAGSVINECKRFGSYFEIYHYLLQRNINKIYESKQHGTTENAFVTESFSRLITEKVYQDQFVKALCSPFGYNVARFKKLTINALFDKDNPKYIEIGENRGETVNRQDIQGEYKGKKSQGSSENKNKGYDNTNNSQNARQNVSQKRPDNNHYNKNSNDGKLSIQRNASNDSGASVLEILMSKKGK